MAQSQPTNHGSSTGADPLTHWGRVTHICLGDLTTIGSDNGLSPGWRQAIIWTNAGLLLIEHLGTNFSEILIEIHIFSFRKMHLKMSSAKWRPFCLGLNMLTPERYKSNSLSMYWSNSRKYHKINHMAEKIPPGKCTLNGGTSYPIYPETQTLHAETLQQLNTKPL